MPRADLEVLDAVAAYQGLPSNYALLIRSAIAELRALRECDAASRKLFPTTNTGAIRFENLYLDGPGNDRLVAARAAVDALD